MAFNSIDLTICWFHSIFIYWSQLSHDDIFSIKAEQQKFRDQFLNEQNKLLKLHDLLPNKDQNPWARRLVELNLNNDDALLTFNNEVETFIDGKVLFQNLIKNIEQAKSSINIEFYTFYDDQLGNQVLKALEKAANRGVKVRVLTMLVVPAVQSPPFSISFDN